MQCAVQLSVLLSGSICSVQIDTAVVNFHPKYAHSLQSRDQSPFWDAAETSCAATAGNTNIVLNRSSDCSAHATIFYCFQ